MLYIGFISAGVRSLQLMSLLPLLPKSVYVTLRGVGCNNVYISLYMLRSTYHQLFFREYASRFVGVCESTKYFILLYIPSRSQGVFFNVLPHWVKWELLRL